MSSLTNNSATRMVENLGRKAVATVEEIGYIFSMLVESFYWMLFGKKNQQPVRLRSVFAEAMAIGIHAIPIITIVCLAIGVMMAIQGIETLKTFGAESKVIVGIAISVTREFAPLIVSILIAGRSGSAITARLGTMLESQEIDALRVIGINPVRYLVAPLLLAMMISIPALTILGDFMGLLGGALYSASELNITIAVYMERSAAVLSWDDIRQGLIKSVVFAAIIVLVAVSNGFQVKGGAEGVGRATTRSVVLSLTFIVLADMIFTFFLNR
ncbi:MAG: ABC transporter permease [Gammaproteobacteria bacterium]|nr:ABC transporter permease [Gammaproteobacteria bacterium]